MGTRSRTDDRSTAERILDVGEQLVQSRGYNAFSYADVAAELDLTKAALHYHFAGKAELGEALLNRYVTRFAEALAVIDAKPVDATSKLTSYADLYLDVLQRQRMCLCGMLAAEFQTLPEPMRTIVVRFFKDNETWLSRVLGAGTHGGNTPLHWLDARGRTFRHRRAGRRHARCPSLWGHRPIPQGRVEFDCRAREQTVGPSLTSDRSRQRKMPRVVRARRSGRPGGLPGAAAQGLAAGLHLPGAVHGVA